MGEPGRSNVRSSLTEYIGQGTRTGAADASAAAPSGDWLGRAAMALPDLIRHLL